LTDFVGAAKRAAAKPCGCWFSRRVRGRRCRWGWP